MVDKRESIKMTAKRWEHLHWLAKELGCVSTRAPADWRGQPSWRTLIGRIADGDFDEALLKSFKVE